MCVCLIVALRNSAVARPSDLRSRRRSTSGFRVACHLTGGPRSIVPKRRCLRRECIHTSPGNEPVVRAPKSIGLSWQKQLLCQFRPLRRNPLKMLYGSEACGRLAPVFGDTTMSNPCRCFYTTSSPVWRMPLIRLVGDDVAEGRQVTGSGTRQGIKPRLSQGHRVQCCCVYDTREVNRSGKQPQSGTTA